MTRTFLLVGVAFCALAANRTDVTVKPVKLEKKRPLGASADLSGYYVCKGKEANGKSYTGVTVISKKDNVYVVQWIVGTGSTFIGVGIRQGDTLSASWALPNDKGVIRGINVYKILPGPRLVGHWTSLPGPGVLQTEELTFLKQVNKK